MEESTRAFLRPTTRGPGARARGRVGFTLLEMLIAVAMIAALSMILLPVASRTRAASRSVSCLANLRALSTAFGLHSHEHGRLPNPATTEIPWERSLAKYLPAEVFRCAADEELAPATGSSYDWRDTGEEATTLANYPLRACNRTDAVLVFDALPSWHQKNRMNAAFVDGSAQSLEQEHCIADLNIAIRDTAIPAPDPADPTDPTGVGGGTGGTSKRPPIGGRGGIGKPKVPLKP